MPKDKKVTNKPQEQKQAWKPKTPKGQNKWFNLNYQPLSLTKTRKHQMQQQASYKRRQKNEQYFN